MLPLSKCGLLLAVLTLTCFESVPAADPQPVVRSADPAAKLANAWFAEGKAAGLEGVFYDNRDRKHSDLPITTYPQLRPITYTKEELARRGDWGGQRQIYPGKIIIGNSSTASPATQAGSHQRMYYTHPRGLAFLHQQYRTNALYIYPEHRDHDPGTNGPDGFGDLYPANSPYIISSQGSSGSDRVFMHAFLKTIAAFPPETQKILIAEGLLMPTLQAIFRQTYKAAPEPADYFTGKAHPSAFEGNLIDELAMVKRAQAMTPDSIPPLVQLKVKSEPDAVSGIDYFEPSAFTAGEHLADTPCAIARIIRGPAHQRTMTVSASESVDRKKRPLRFRWMLLRGDPNKVSITPSEDGAEAEITVAYHPRRPIAPGSDLWSNRIDIGVFAKAEGNSTTSAPAFISFSTLPNEHRTYDEEGRLLEIFYGARSRSLGIPPADSDRWDALLTRFDTRPDQPALAVIFDESQTKTLAQLAADTKDLRTKVAAANEKLKTITAAQQKVVDETNKFRIDATAAHKKEPGEKTKAALDVANADHNAAKKAMRDGEDGAAALKMEIASLRSEVTTTIRAAKAPETVRAALTQARNGPIFFSQNEVAIRALAEGSALNQTLDRFQATGVTESEAPPPNELYHLSQRNTDILADVLLPEFLKRPPGFNYVDPRLTSTKRWRDVYHYEDSGKLTGWTRYQSGKPTEFTPESAAKLRYAIDPKSKLLDIIPSE